MFDIVVQLNCGFLYRGMIILDRKRIVSSYLRTYFIWDFMEIMVFLIAYIGQLYEFNYLKLILFIKIFRISDCDDCYVRKLNIHRGLKTIYVIFKLVVIILVLSHVVGFIFFAMDNYFIHYGYYPPDCTYIFIIVCWLVSSLARNDIYLLDWPIQYVYTLYWGVNTITTISYGDIAPLNPIETNYCTLMFCFGFIVYGYAINQIVKILMWARGTKDEFRA